MQRRTDESGFRRVFDFPNVLAGNISSFPDFAQRMASGECLEIGILVEGSESDRGRQFFNNSYAGEPTLCGIEDVIVIDDLAGLGCRPGL